MIEAVLAVLHRMVWADGDADPREIEVGVRVAHKMLGPVVEADHVAAVLSSPEAPEHDLASLPEDARFVVFRAAALVARADEVIDPSEVAILEKLGAELQLNDQLVADVVAGLHADVEARKELSVLKSIAAELLGVAPDAGADAIRATYRARMLAAVSDADDPEEAAELGEQIAWAYHTLLG